MNGWLTVLCYGAAEFFIDFLLHNAADVRSHDLDALRKLLQSSTMGADQTYADVGHGPLGLKQLICEPRGR